MSSGWHSALAISHPDEILPIAKSSGRLRVQISLCNPDDIGHLVTSHPDQILSIAKSSGWLKVQISLWHPHDIGHLVISHPDEILPIDKSYGRPKEQLSFTCHPDDLLHRQWIYWLMHMTLGVARILDLHITGPFVRESTRNAALCDWYCFVVRLNKMLINQSRRRWVQKLWHSCDVTVMS